MHTVSPKNTGLEQIEITPNPAETFLLQTVKGVADIPVCPKEERQTGMSATPWVIQVRTMVCSLFQVKSEQGGMFQSRGELNGLAGEAIDRFCPGNRRGNGIGGDRGAVVIPKSGDRRFI